MDTAVVQLITLLVQLALQVAPEVETEAKIVIDAINGTPPTDDQITQLAASVQKLKDKADLDANAGFATPPVPTSSDASV